MECIECEKPVEGDVLVAFSTGETKQLPLCTECKEAYAKGEFVSAVKDDHPDSGGESRHLAKCTTCGEIYPAQMSAENNLRPVGLEDGTCVCGNPEFRPFVEK